MLAERLGVPLRDGLAVAQLPLAVVRLVRKLGSDGLASGLVRALVAVESLERDIQSLDERLAHLEPLPQKLDSLRESFGGTRDAVDELRAALAPVTDELARLRATVEPVADDVSDVRDAVQPLQPAAERVGRLAEKLPGKS